MIKNYKVWLNEAIDPLSKLTQAQVDWCNNHIKEKWGLNSKGEVTVARNLTLDGNFKKFEVKFADVKGDFYCYGCTSLTSLEGAPSTVGGNFCCDHCTSLSSLEGAPSTVRGAFYSCIGCTSLTSLEGAPSTVRGDFDCRGCTSLASLEGAPYEVSGDFDCYGCDQVPKEELDMLDSDAELFFKWLKSGKTFKEFKVLYRPLISGRKLGL